MTEPTTMTAVEKTVWVPLAPERAFELFTREVVTWWPIDTHAINPGEVRDIVWEERVGGEVYELSTDGDRCRWGTVLTWEPPSRLAMTWEVNPDRLGLELDVRFAADGDGTRLDLEHRGWDQIADGAQARTGYDTGWDHVLGRFTSAASA